MSTSATDLFTGGAGNDTFQFAQLPGSTPDQITDFTPGSDLIALNSAVFDLHGKTLADAFASGNAQTEAEGAHLTFNQEDHTLYYDSDGAANNNSVAVVTLAGVNSLAAGDLAMIA
ncbi:hypothetical protein PPUJ20028_38590 [Pseudomonas putida]|uniref:Peptidase M10 serralysin C-terminal domain-containing protein n=1 Tax=Pseudomonas putida TaxID=303 RepID=A0AA37RD10_PSEPU|nr:hypothetical protein [Pseudomonas putida]GLO15274.1 hypothetical protein PPUJ20028_38590 [Pseudomonas putida]GLO33351.1 hypothetical protein PPUN14671_01840 [Pseudomonas putida]HDS0965376.1 hypothetical protein [Pseudomonas putida]HDS0990519.1 hypothetical protein [Pseudomonas putida]